MVAVGERTGLKAPGGDATGTVTTNRNIQSAKGAGSAQAWLRAVTRRLVLAAAAAEGGGVGHARANVAVVSTLNGATAAAAPAGTLARAAVGSSVVATSVVLQAEVVAVAVDA